MLSDEWNTIMHAYYEKDSQSKMNKQGGISRYGRLENSERIVVMAMVMDGQAI